MKRFKESCRRVFVSLLAAGLGLYAPARTSPQDVTSVEFHQTLLDLSNHGVVMNLSAHPDDEDGSTLAYYRMKFGAKTYSILFTRGEGGQNEIGPDLYEELGVLRTRETLEAGKILGAEVHFLNLTDFGYSKTATETLTKWGGQGEVLRRLVFVIRKYKPDVIFTNHSTVEGHGHHQVVAITAISAFDAAADSTMFPEQLRQPGISIWQPRKLFFRNFGRSNQEADVVNAIGDTNVLRGKSYLDIATDALRMHKTQGMDRANLRRFTRGLSLYRLVRSNSIYDRDTTTFLGGITFSNDQSFASLHSLNDELLGFRVDMDRDSLLAKAGKTLRVIASMDPNRATPLVLRTLQHLRDDIERLVQLSCGVSASLTLADKILVPNQKVLGKFLLKSSSCKIGDTAVSLSLPEGWSCKENSSTQRGKKEYEVTREFEIKVEENPVFSLPQTVAQYNPIEHEEEIVARAQYSVNGYSVSMSVRPVFDVAPSIVLTCSPSVTRISTARLNEGKELPFTIKNFRPTKTAGKVVATLPNGWSGEPESYVIAAQDSTFSGTLRITAPVKTKAGEYKLRLNADQSFADVMVKVFNVNVDEKIKIGIVKSYDNTLETVVEELGNEYKLLEGKDLKGDLSFYRTIVIDIRAYLVRDDLKESNQRILEYVKQGGHLVVMYQKDQDWKPEYAPFPFTLSRKRVSVEEAPMTMLRPDHPLFNVPNKITTEDWNDWKQERAVYFPENVGSQYEQLLSSADPDERPLTTGYLTANVGRGSYIYTSYVWYRQLKEYNIGAWRNFANMICYPNYRQHATSH